MLGIAGAVFADRYRAFASSSPLDAEARLEQWASEPLKSVEPAAAKEDFAKIYGALVEFARRNDRLPTREDLNGQLNPATLLHLDPEDFRLPDLGNTIHYGAKDLPVHYTLSFLNQRPNGEPKIPAPGEGQRDVWLVSTMHHEAGRPVHVVLWSDGAIEVIPAGDAVKLPVTADQVGAKADHIVYPGQSGLTQEQQDFLESRQEGPSPSIAEVALPG